MLSGHAAKAEAPPVLASIADRPRPEPDAIQSPAAATNLAVSQGVAAAKAASPPAAWPRILAAADEAEAHRPGTIPPFLPPSLLGCALSDTPGSSLPTACPAKGALKAS